MTKFKKIKKSKKADLDIFNYWVEYTAIIVLFIGFLLSLISKSAFISYCIITISGLITGRVLYKKREDLKIPLFLIILGFIAGYILGTYLRYGKGSVSVVIALFITSNIFSYWLHNEGYVRA